MAAAGNQGRLAIGQLLSHKTTVPVVALDAHGEILPDSNFGPPTSRWVAALGHQVPGMGRVVASPLCRERAWQRPSPQVLWLTYGRSVGTLPMPTFERPLRCWARAMGKPLQHFTRCRF